MNWMNKLEKKWGRYAVPNLSRYFVAAMVIGYLVSWVAPGLMEYMYFDMGAILHGQIWRLVTWIITPATSMDIFGILFLFCVLMWGSSLETFLGTFRMNVFLWGGVILSDIIGVLLYGISFLILGTPVSIYLSTYYILMSMLLALAVCMPEGEVRLYFVLPIKMKWMLLFELVYLGYQVIRIFYTSITALGVQLGIVYGFVAGTQIIAAVLNMFLFFWFSRTRVSRKQKKRQKEFRAQFSQPRPGSGISQHKCVICGRTELTNPELTFRYCSKCSGNREYCEEHLFTHEHIK
ncbi:MAG: hypothetical protein PUF65_09240 [Lachnospiraceae bacterium]|nr:hypothetical protein [Lachnospiraceae bacterium]